MNKEICCDSSVLINFLRIDRLDLFAKCPCPFYITDHVREEILASFQSQKASLETGIKQEILQVISAQSEEELALFTTLKKDNQLGSGECAAIAAASHRGYGLAIDDAQAIKKASGLLLPSSIFRTQDLVLLMIQEGCLAIEEADRLIEMWATKHRFKLKIQTFREIYPILGR
jgi:predicted nucleic acid-binding protein